MLGWLGICSIKFCNWCPFWAMSNTASVNVSTKSSSGEYPPNRLGYANWLPEIPLFPSVFMALFQAPFRIFSRRTANHEHWDSIA